MEVSDRKHFYLLLVLNLFAETGGLLRIGIKLMMASSMTSQVCVEIGNVVSLLYFWR